MESTNHLTDLVNDLFCGIAVLFSPFPFNFTNYDIDEGFRNLSTVLVCISFSRDCPSRVDEIAITP